MDDRPNLPIVQTRSKPAAVHVTVCRYGDSAVDHFEAWPERKPLYQIQFVHAGRPSFSEDFQASLASYLDVQFHEDGPYPPNIEIFESMFRAQIQVAGPEWDLTLFPCAVPGRVAIYVAGVADDASSVIHLLLDYVAHWRGRLECRERDQLRDLVLIE